MQAIVTKFERPLNPGPEIAGAEKAYVGGTTTYGIAGGVSSPTGLTAQPPRPGGSGGGSSFWGSIESALGGAAHTVASPFESLYKDAEDAIKGPVDFLRALLWLVNPLTWLRAVEVIIGTVLILAGLAVALGADRAIKSAGPVGLAAGAAEDIAAAA